MNQFAKTFIRADQLDTQRDLILDVSLIPRRKKLLGALVRAPGLLLSQPGIPGVPHEAVIAVYGDSDMISAAVVEHLKRNGYTRAAQLKGGFESWRDFGMPLEDRG